MGFVNLTPVRVECDEHNCPVTAIVHVAMINPTDMLEKHVENYYRDVATIAAREQGWNTRYDESLQCPAHNEMR